MQTEVPPMHTRSIAQGQQNKTETTEIKQFKHCDT